MAALLVFTGHMAVIMGIAPPTFAGYSLHVLGVNILFIIGGYLIGKSWKRDRHPGRYAIRRFFRLWPPFAVTVLLLTFVFGPLLSEYGAGGYFTSNWTNYLKNLRFEIVFAQPGVFGDVPIRYSSNGSFWTMPVEAVAYILPPLLLGRSAKRTIKPLVIITVCLAAVDLGRIVLIPDCRIVFYGTDILASLHLIVLFLEGVILSEEALEKYLNLQTGLAGICGLLILQFLPAAIGYGLFYLVFPYFIISFATAAKPVFKDMGKRLEPSYGIYLYGFFFQQWVMQYQMHHNLNWGYFTCLALSFIPTFIAAVLSYFLIEKPMVKNGGMICGKMSKHK